MRYCDITYSPPVMAAICDLPVTRMSKSVHTSPAVLLDPENVGVVFGISLLSCLEAEIVRYFICTSGNGGFLLWWAFVVAGLCHGGFLPEPRFVENIQTMAWTKNARQPV